MEHRLVPEPPQDVAAAVRAAVRAARLVPAAPPDAYTSPWRTAALTRDDDATDLRYVASRPSRRGADRA
jgi:hypothetical protein